LLNNSGAALGRRNVRGTSFPWNYNDALTAVNPGGCPEPRRRIIRIEVGIATLITIYFSGPGAAM